MSEKFWYCPVSSAMPFATSSITSRLVSLMYSCTKVSQTLHLATKNANHLAEKEDESGFGDSVMEVIEAARRFPRLQSFCGEADKFLGVSLEQGLDYWWSTQ